MGSHVSKHEPSSAIGVKIHPELLGAGVLFSVLLNTLRFFHETDAFSFSLQPFAIATGWGIIACALVVCTMNAVQLRRGRPAFSSLGSASIALGGIATLFGITYLLPFYAGFVLPFIEPALFGIAFGSGLLLLATAWGQAFAQLEPENLLFNSALNVMVAAILHFAAELMSPSLIGFIFIVGSCVMSLALLLYTRAHSAAIHTASCSTEATIDDNLPARRKRIAKAVSILWMPVIGACITSFIFGLTWDPIASGEPLRSDAPMHVWKLLIGPVITSAIIACMVARKPGASTLRLLNQAIYPIAVALLLALPVVIVDNTVVTTIVELLKPASFSVIVLAIWFSIANAVRSVPLAASVAIPSCLLLLACAFVGGLYGIAVIGTSGRTICLVILTMYLALITISYALGNKNQKDSRSESRIADSRTYIHRRCDELSNAHGLSPREREVLYYLGRGYNHSFVAEKLYISENTVRTHVRHIYSKLNINSREELLELIDASDDGVAAGTYIGDNHEPA